jgi:6-phosphogluconolactonase
VDAEVVIDSVSALATRVSRELEERAGGAIATHGHAVVALSGGSIGPLFYPRLADTRTDWTRIHFFWIDERAVPPDHAESNYALAARLWLTPASVPAICVHRMRGEDPDLARAARAASEELVRIAGDPPRIDLALVGVGEDGHVASIFPGSEDQRTTGAARHHYVLPVYDSPKPPARRLTMTLEVLASVRRAVLIAVGGSKAGAIGAALSPTRETPVGRLLPRLRSPLLLLDHDAAAAIGR